MATKADRLPAGDFHVVWGAALDAAELGRAFRARDSWVVFEPKSAYGHWASVIGNLLGRKMPEDSAPFSLVRKVVHGGIDRAAFDRIKELVGLSTDELSRLAGISKRTLSRRSTKFKPDETERLIRIASVFHNALEVLEDLGAARRWMTSPKQALEGLAPIECCDTEAGAREVEDLLNRIEHGVFS